MKRSSLVFACLLSLTAPAVASAQHALEQSRTFALVADGDETFWFASVGEHISPDERRLWLWRVPPADRLSGEAMVLAGTANCRTERIEMTTGELYRSGRFQFSMDFALSNHSRESTLAYNAVQASCRDNRRMTERTVSSLGEAQAFAQRRRAFQAQSGRYEPPSALTPDTPVRVLNIHGSAALFVDEPIALVGEERIARIWTVYRPAEGRDASTLYDTVRVDCTSSRAELLNTAMYDADVTREVQFLEGGIYRSAEDFGYDALLNLVCRGPDAAPSAKLLKDRRHARSLAALFWLAADNAPDLSEQ